MRRKEKGFKRPKLEKAMKGVKNIVRVKTHPGTILDVEVEVGIGVTFGGVIPWVKANPDRKKSL